ncbi:acyltransferase family protein [Paraburkholderia sediminicola]|uniref:acyltransferase family protein n=1 Tax=Paraburkholderia sediminicola TaxID=458836 RepID=UPI0038BCF5A2
MKQPDIPALTGLRGLAAMLIVMHHLGLLILPLGRTDLSQALHQFGLLGMSTFFVLSGFVIHYNYAARIHRDGARGVKSFLLARFARLYPLYFLFVCLNFVHNIWTAPSSTIGSVYIATLPGYLIGIQAWVYSVIGGYNFSLSQEYANNAWSISAEVFLYLIFVPLVLLFNFERPSQRRGLIIVTLGITARILFVLWVKNSWIGAWIGAKFGIASYISPVDWLVYFSPYGRFFEFMAGMGIAEIWRARAHEPASRNEALTVRILTYVALLYVLAACTDGVFFNHQYLLAGERVHIGYAIAMPIIVYSLCRRHGITAALIRSAPLIFLGDISYSLYLLHGNVLALFRMDVSGDLKTYVPMMLLRASLGIATVLVLSWIVFRFVEMPLKKFVMGHRPVADRASLIVKTEER